MARLPRYNLPGQPQHVILRGNNRRIIFAADDDYRFFVDCLEDAATRHGCAIHAYVLMTPERDDRIGKALQSLGRRYVQYFNDSYLHTGALWEGRYKATLIDSKNYLLTCHRYIELNPVRAGITAHPRDYAWSSYRWHAQGEADKLVTDHALYLTLGKSRPKRQAAYRALFKSRIGETTLTAIREATHKSWVLGTGRFHEEIAAAVNRRVAPIPKGRPR